ncbi:hypothetical protein R3P38DRAFT_2883060 [Favolaschia claudopus]|uniref:Uncharacterized protein n=1 Tax=Favolaschia claudopus TaxID=2862362 RepID=A0AAW0D1S5_9AGAR
MRISRVVWALSVAVTVAVAQTGTSTSSIDNTGILAATDLPGFPPFSSPDATPAVNSSISTETTNSTTSSKLRPGPTRSAVTVFPPSDTDTSSISSDAVVTGSSNSGFATSSSEASSSSSNQGPIIAAAVGGSVAVTLALLAAILFCFFRSARLRRHLGVSPPPSSEKQPESQSHPHLQADLAWRCTSLENEMSVLRERLTRLEVRDANRMRDEASRRAPAVMYSNEKDGVALDGKVAKDRPPTYLD